MTGRAQGGTLENAIFASWKRCERKYNMVRDVAHPVLRMQSTEVAQRLDEVIDRTGGRRGIFQQIAELAAASDQCLSIGDADGVLVRIESKYKDGSEDRHYSVSLGSCWDERLAGTNGLALAMTQNETLTVRGDEHFFAKFHPFSCIATPLLDAENQIIGGLNITTVNRRNEAEYAFARHLLETAATKVQRLLFRQKFKDALLISISQAEQNTLLSKSDLVAVDEAGRIIGATSDTYKLLDLNSPEDLVGQKFDDVFETGASTLDASPEQVQNATGKRGQMLSFAALRQPTGLSSLSGQAPLPAKMRPQRVRRRLPPTLRQLLTGSENLSGVFELAQAHFNRALPFSIEGASGTGKTALVAALHAADRPQQSQLVTVDCAALEDNEAGRSYIDALFEQAFVADALDDTENDLTTLVFDNVDELPGFAQRKLRSLLASFETALNPLDDTAPASAIRVVATCRFPLGSAVREGRLRDDLYHLLASARIELPPLHRRQRPEAIAAVIAAELAGCDVALTTEAEDAIRRHSWPGNMHELRGALRQALLIGDGHRITLPDLLATSAFSASNTGWGGEEPNALRVASRVYDEATLLRDALISSNWNVSRAAANLGIGRTTIHRKMKQFGITRPGQS